jgi:hypothetical protein
MFLKNWNGSLFFFCWQKRPRGKRRTDQSLRTKIQKKIKNLVKISNQAIHREAYTLSDHEPRDWLLQAYDMTPNELSAKESNILTRL